MCLCRLCFFLKVEAHWVQLQTLGCLVTLVRRLLLWGVVVSRSRIQCLLHTCFFRLKLEVSSMGHMWHWMPGHRLLLALCCPQVARCSFRAGWLLKTWRHFSQVWHRPLCTTLVWLSRYFRLENDLPHSVQTLVTPWQFCL